MDIAIRAIQDDGDMTLIGNDLEVFRGYENMPYTGTFNAGSEGADWWGNSLVPGNSFKFSSETEKILDTTPLTSSGRIIIENAILRDLKFITDNTPGTELKVVVQIVSDDELRITVSVNGEEFFINWNPDYQQPQIAPNPGPPQPIQALYHWSNGSITEAGGNLSKWYDIGPNANTIDNAEAPATPIPIDSDVVINGHDFLVVSGSGQNVYTHDKLQLSHTNKVTMIVVMKKATAPGGVRTLISTSEPGQSYQNINDSFGVYFSGITMASQMNYDSSGFKTRAVLPGNNWHIFEFQYDRSLTPKILIDGVQVAGNDLGAGGSTPANFGDHYLYIGTPAGDPPSVRIAEIIVYDDILTPDERVAIYAPLQTYFNL